MPLGLILGDNSLIFVLKSLQVELRLLVVIFFALQHGSVGLRVLLSNTFQEELNRVNKLRALAAQVSKIAVLKKRIIIIKKYELIDQPIIERRRVKLLSQSQKGEREERKRKTYVAASSTAPLYTTLPSSNNNNLSNLEKTS